MKLNVLVVGQGGREHALAWKIAQSPELCQLYVLPGNPGTAKLAENVPIHPMAFAEIACFCEVRRIDLVVIGPDDLLAAGLADYLRLRGFNVFGPDRKAAEIESSKAFAAELMEDAGIPTASSGTYHRFIDAVECLPAFGLPVVIKTSGLARGKGAMICSTEKEARDVLKRMLVDYEFGDAGRTVVIQKFLRGQEISIHELCDVQVSRPFSTAQDHKAVENGDKGPNTGGMGVISPVPWITDEHLGQIKDQIVDPILSRLTAIGRPFNGCLYPGLMLTSEGFQVLEVNARFGDPETQALLPRLKSDLLPVLFECACGRSVSEIEWHPGFTCCVILASGGYGYSDDFLWGFEISGLDEAERIPEVNIFHAGTAVLNGGLVTAGGRVLGVTARGATLKAAIDLAYQAVRCIHFRGMHYRTDIGAKCL